MNGGNGGRLSNWDAWVPRDLDGMTVRRGRTWMMLADQLPGVMRSTSPPKKLTR